MTKSCSLMVIITAMLCLIGLVTPLEHLAHAQTLKEMKVVDQGEAKGVVVRNPEVGILIVTSVIPNLSFESNMGIIKVDDSDPGRWVLHLHPGTNLITFKAEGYKSVSRVRLVVPRKKAHHVEVQPVVPPDSDSLMKAQEEIRQKAISDSLMKVQQEMLQKTLELEKGLQELEEKGEGKTLEGVDRSMLVPKRPFYKTWWFWTEVGVVAAARNEKVILCTNVFPSIQRFVMDRPASKVPGSLSTRLYVCWPMQTPLKNSLASILRLNGTIFWLVLTMRPC